ncbi:hypothetical protein [Nocardia salmonicida]|uniref:hypothetical protein n=1 Tax=Nocardia salmonicida TaxID=53431 RepID=UPI003403A679
MHLSDGVDTGTAMSDSEVLSAEYRAFIKALHPHGRYLDAVASFSMQKLFPSVVAVSARDKSEADRGLDPLERPEAELDHECRHDVRTKLLTLVHGHPDPDAREAADCMARLCVHLLHESRSSRAEAR